MTGFSGGRASPLTLITIWVIRCTRPLSPPIRATQRAGRGGGAIGRPNGRRAGHPEGQARYPCSTRPAPACLPPCHEGHRQRTRRPPQPESHRVRAPKADGPAIRHRPNRHQATAKMKALAGSETPAHLRLPRGTRARRPFLSPTKGDVRPDVLFRAVALCSGEGRSVGKRVPRAANQRSGLRRSTRRAKPCSCESRSPERQA